MLVFAMAALMTMASATRAAPTVNYVALGDSLGAGMGAKHGFVERLSRLLRAEEGGGVKLHNLSSGGATTADVLRTQLPRVAGLRPRLVPLTIGTKGCTH